MMLGLPGRSTGTMVLLCSVAAAAFGLAGCAGVATNDPFGDGDAAPSGSSGGSSGGPGGSSSSGGASSSSSSSSGGGSSGGGSSSSSSSSSSGGSDAGGGTEGGGTVGYAANIAPIMSSACLSCHANAASTGLMISYATIVSIKSTESPAVNYVTPGSPGTSYLYCKINPNDSACAATTITGSTMPIGATLPGSSVSMIKTWITQGALP